MLEGIGDSDTLVVYAILMHGIQMKLLKGEKLSKDEEKILKLNLLRMGGEFRDEKHRDKLFAQWWKGAKILAKKFKEEKKGGHQ